MSHKYAIQTQLQLNLIWTTIRPLYHASFERRQPTGIIPYQYPSQVEPKCLVNGKIVKKLPNNEYKLACNIKNLASLFRHTVSRRWLWLDERARRWKSGFLCTNATYLHNRLDSIVLSSVAASLAENDFLLPVLPPGLKSQWDISNPRMFEES